MKVAEVANKLKQQGIDVVNMKIDTTYFLRLSNKSTIHLCYRDDKFTDIKVMGKDECVEQTKKILDIKE